MLHVGHGYNSTFKAITKSLTLRIHLRACVSGYISTLSKEGNWTVYTHSRVWTD